MYRENLCGRKRLTLEILEVRWFPVVVVVLASLAAGILDVWKFKIPNILTLPLCLGGVIFHTLAWGESGAGLGPARSLLGVLVGFSLLIGFYMSGAMLGGDVKLLAGVGAWLGPGPTPSVFLASSLAAGVYAVVVLCFVKGAWRGVFSRRKNLQSELLQPNRRRRLIPFGAMIAVGVLALLCWPF